MAFASFIGGSFRCLLLYSVRAALPIEQRCGDRRSVWSETLVSMEFDIAGRLQKATKDVYKRSFILIMWVCTGTKRETLSL